MAELLLKDSHISVTHRERGLQIVTYPIFPTAILQPLPDNSKIGGQFSRTRKIVQFSLRGL
jgi:hypothetical protein